MEGTELIKSLSREYQPTTLVERSAFLKQGAADVIRLLYKRVPDFILKNAKRTKRLDKLLLYRRLLHWLPDLADHLNLDGLTPDRIHDALPGNILKAIYRDLVNPYHFITRDAIQLGLQVGFEAVAKPNARKVTAEHTNPGAAQREDVFFRCESANATLLAYLERSPITWMTHLENDALNDKGFKDNPPLQSDIWSRYAQTPMISPIYVLRVNEDEEVPLWDYNFVRTWLSKMRKGGAGEIVSYNDWVDRILR